MKVLTVATHSDGYYPLLEMQCQKLGYELRTLGMGQKWQGLDWKIELYLQELITLPPQEVVMCIDGHDVVIIAPPQQVLKKFQQLSTSFLISGQRIYSSHKWIQALADKIMTDDLNFNNNFYPFKMTPYNRPCTGLMMGEVQRFREIFSHLQELNHNPIGNDQILMTKYYLQNPNEMMLDTKCQIFQNLWKSRGPFFGAISCLDQSSEVTLEMNPLTGKREVKNKLTQEFPCLIHGPKNLNMNPLLKELGFHPPAANFLKQINYLRYSVFYYIKRFFKLFKRKISYKVATSFNPQK